MVSNRAVRFEEKIGVLKKKGQKQMRSRLKGGNMIDIAV